MRQTQLKRTVSHVFARHEYRGLKSSTREKLRLVCIFILVHFELSYLSYFVVF